MRRRLSTGLETWFANERVTGVFLVD